MIWRLRVSISMLQYHDPSPTPPTRSQLDRLLAEADSIPASPVYADIGLMAEELRELIVDMQAKVEEKPGGNGTTVNVTSEQLWDAI